MNKIDFLFKQKSKNVLSIYFPAGFPKLNDTKKNIELCLKMGVDMIEIGIPFSDSLADGLVIQKAHNKALKNGMNLNILFEQLKTLDFKNIEIPILLMGYWNTVFQYDVEKFIKQCEETGISGVIIPDLTIEEYISNYKNLFEKNGIHNIFLVTPNTSPSRLELISNYSNGFIYMISVPSTTGSQVLKEDIISQEKYFKNIAALGLSTMIGFGISNKEKFALANKFANGAIIGSAYVKALSNNREKEFLLQFKK